MRNTKAAISSVLVAGSLAFGGITGTQASNFLGVFCWDLQTEYGPATLKLAVTDMGGAHFIVNGVVTPESPEPIQGNAEIVGNKVLLAMSSGLLDDVDHGMSASSWSMSLDLPTLSGRFKSFGQDYYGEAFEPLGYVEGTATFTNCP